MVPKQRIVPSVPKENVVIQAVLIADSFETHFDVITQDRPKALIPFLNQPLIDYSLGLLRYNGVQEVFLYCCHLQKQVRDHVKNVWCDSGEMVVHVFSSGMYQSTGDVFRDLDAKALIKGNFILIRGDVIGNIPLVDFLEKHKARKAADKGCVMTSIYCRRLFNHRSMASNNDLVCVTDLNGKIIGYENQCEGRKKIKIPLESFRDYPEVVIRKDIQDTHISICSVNMLMSFSENVDHQSKHDFIHGSLVDQEIHGNSIYIAIAEEAYGARVTHPRDYHCMSQDLICGWNHPVVPEKFLSCCKNRNNVYVHKNNKKDLVRYSLRNILIGPSTSLGHNVQIQNSVIGSNCSIGNNVELDGVYIWDNVKIGDNCKLSSTIIANDVVVKDGVVLSKGCLISPSVTIGSKISLENAFITKCEHSKSDERVVGPDGFGVLYHLDADTVSRRKKDKHLFTWDPDVEIKKDQELSDEGESDSEGSELEAGNDEEDVKIFFKELVENFERGVIERISCDNLVLEVNSIKHAFNIPIDEVNLLVIQALLHLPDHMKGHFDGDFYSQMKSVFTIFLKLIKNYIKSRESQVICLRAMEQVCINRKDLLTTARLCKLIMMLYEEDVLEDESILEWYANAEPLPNLMVFEEDPLQYENQINLRKEEVLKKFIVWLEEAEEESDSE